MRTIKRISLWLVLAICLLWPASFPNGTAVSEAPPSLQGAVQAKGNLYVVSFVDVLPTFIEATRQLLREYATASRNDPGLVRFEVIAQANGRENHMTMIAVWATQKAFENHEAAQHTKTFREKLLPYQGAPFDQRYNYLIPAK